MPLAVTTDELRGQNLLTLPAASEFTPTPDRFQIARRRGALTGAPALPITDDEIIATVPATQTTFIDRAPFPIRNAYSVRGRIATDPDRFTAWTNYANVTSSRTLRQQTLSPFNVLELRPAATGTGVAAAVETSSANRFRVKGAGQYRLVLDYRALIAASSTDVLRWGIRCYNKDGVLLSDSYTDTSLTLSDSQSPTGRLSNTFTPVSGTYEIAILFEYRGAASLANKIRIENVELYRTEGDQDSLWEYLQVPNPDGLVPDQRPELVDLTALTFDGVGWSYVSAPPAGYTYPYRQSSTPDDEYAVLSTGEWIEFLFYGHTATARVEVSRLVDSSIGKTRDPDPTLWEPVIDPNVVGGTLALGNNLVINSTFDTDTTGWTNLSSALDDFQNGITVDTAAMARQTSGPITGAASLQAGFRFLGEGVSCPFPAYIFRAGTTYRLRVDLKRNGTTDQAVTVAFGSSSPRYVDSANNKYFLADRVVKNVTVTTTTQQVEIFWTPIADQAYAYVAVLANQTNSVYTDTILIDNVTVQECLGYDLAAQTNDFTPIALELPGAFSPRHATPYRVRVLSGTVRPYGLRRDPVNTVDLKSDFETVLRALGNMRNATFGEIEFRADNAVPLVKHHSRRGRDHSKIQNGLDLRFGKNIVSRKRQSEVTNLTNRLLVVGYGDNQTQLVHEVRSLKDVQGRLPTDPSYRRDSQDRAAPGLVQVWNRFRNPSAETNTTGWAALSNTTMSNPTAAGGYGSKFIRATAVGAGVFGVSAGGGVAPDGRIPVTANKKYVVSVLPIALTAGRQVRIFIQWWRADGGGAATSTSSYTNVMGTRLELIATAPSNAISMHVEIQTDGGAAGNVLDVDGLSVYESDISYGYVEGDQANSGWAGTANASYSYLYGTEANWDKYTGGTSEDIYGPRYGIYRDANINTTYQAQEQGTAMVELSAWPAETYELSIVDMTNVPYELEPGDLVLIRYGGRDLLRRVIEIENDIANPRSLLLTLGEDENELVKAIERVTRDVETALSAINSSST